VEYILLIHNNAEKAATEEQWNMFFQAATQSGLFAGGSEIAKGELIGSKDAELLSCRLAGHMRFRAGAKTELVKLHRLLKMHPTVLQGGTIELCAMPKSQLNNSVP